MSKNDSITEVSKTHLMFLIITFMQGQIEGADESREGGESYCEYYPALLKLPNDPKFYPEQYLLLLHIKFSHYRFFRITVNS